MRLRESSESLFVNRSLNHARVTIKPPDNEFPFAWQRLSREELRAFIQLECDTIPYKKNLLKSPHP